jgi:tRNA(adenine34) deaminase
MVHARIERLVYGATDPKTGVIDSRVQALQLPTVNHCVQVTAGIMAEECGEILRQFFKAKRLKST